VYGTNNDIVSHFHSLYATSRYTLDGFQLAGGIHHSTGDYTFPEILAGQTSQASQVDSTTYDLSLSRGLARYSTTTWLNYSRNTTSYSELGEKDSQTNDVVTGGVAFKPTKKLNASFGADYDDNLAGAFYQAESSAGSVVPLALPTARSHSWGYTDRRNTQSLKTFTSPAP